MIEQLFRRKRKKHKNDILTQEELDKKLDRFKNKQFEFNDFLFSVDWKCKDRRYWRYIFSRTDGFFDWNAGEGDHTFLFKGRYSDIMSIEYVRLFKSVVNHNEKGERIVSTTIDLTDIIKRIRYVKRGNTLHCTKVRKIGHGEYEYDDYSLKYKNYRLIQMVDKKDYDWH